MKERTICQFYSHELCETGFEWRFRVKLDCENWVQVGFCPGVHNVIDRGVGCVCASILGVCVCLHSLRLLSFGFYGRGQSGGLKGSRGRSFILLWEIFYIVKSDLDGVWTRIFLLCSRLEMISVICLLLVQK